MQAGHETKEDIGQTAMNIINSTAREPALVCEIRLATCVVCVWY